ncbi:tellurium resistance protein [Methylovulum psychrotolerans]|uniref:Tellurium resistance protein n=2 Tax=Methylovulum psychrotolerans TaxID=1704499 RepID=A0A2S5CG07_9GAMM|nr:tellurium resistance protein [Methylovulum psychrotolerans]
MTEPTHMNILRGQRLNLADLIDVSTLFTLEATVDAPVLRINFSCFGLDADSKLADKRYMSFYNQPTTPCGGVLFKCPDNNAAIFTIDLQKLPAAVERLVIAAAIDGYGVMSQMGGGLLALAQRAVKRAVYTFVGSDFSAEKALIVMEIYRREGKWRICAQGQGFNSGSDVLIRYFGGTVTPAPPPAPTQNVAQQMPKPLSTDNGAGNVPESGNLSGYWQSQGTAVTVAYVTVQTGLLYFGSDLRSIGSRAKIEPALINPKLPIGKLTAANYRQPLLPYELSYSEFSPTARAAYLKWLEQGRNDPLASISYVFLYFYGLERRALVDATTDPAAKAELPNIIQAAERLLETYRDNAYFSGYATRFLAFVKFDSPETCTLKQYLAAAPDLKPAARPLSLPLNVKLALGQLAVDKVPVPACWAYAWLMADTNIRLKTPAHRCSAAFKQLFTDKYSESFGNGMRLPVNKTKIKASYYTASPSFSYRDLEKKLDIPDVTVLTSCTHKLQALADECAARLSAYSRFLGRNPDQENTSTALLELPYTLWPEGQKQPLQVFRQTLAASQTPIELQFAQLKAGLPDWHTLSKPSMTAFINRLAEAGLGMEPDPQFGGGITHEGSNVVLFLDSGPQLTPSAHYSAAALALHLAAVVALADGDAGASARAVLGRHIEGWPYLETAEKNRLQAHCRWLLSDKPTLKSVKKRLGTLSLPASEALADLLVQVANADHGVSANQVKVLETIYALLNLDVQALYGKLHGTGADEPIIVRAAAATSGGFRIPPPTKPTAPTGVQLDMGRIAALKDESKHVTAMLVAIFDQECVPEMSVPTPIPAGSPEDLWGLDTLHSGFIRRLCARPQWSRAELEAIAAECGIIMLDGALEQINEAAFDLFDVAYTEGDDPIDINQDINQEIVKELSK